MTDDTEQRRRFLAAYVNQNGVPTTYTGPLWDTETMQKDFEVSGFMAPFVVVKRKSDGQKGCLTFVHSPRIYFDFVPSS